MNRTASTIRYHIFYRICTIHFLGPTQAGYPQGGSAQTQGLGQGKFVCH